MIQLANPIANNCAMDKSKLFAKLFGDFLTFLSSMAMVPIKGLI